MTIEIVDFPINSMVIFHSYVTVYQRVSILKCGFHQKKGVLAAPTIWSSPRY
jgi:hypothetical protein